MTSSKPRVQPPKYWWVTCQWGDSSVSNKETRKFLVTAATGYAALTRVYNEHNALDIPQTANMSVYAARDISGVLV